MKKITLGIIGMGNRGAGFFGQYSEDERYDVIAVCDKSEIRLKEIKETFPSNVKCFSDMDEMLAMPNLDAVIVATNDTDHVQPILHSLAAGKHVLAEKPLCQSVEESQLIADAVQSSKGVFMMGFELRNCPVFVSMKKLLSEGRIGDIKVAHCFDNVSVGGAYFFHNPKYQKAFYKSLLLQKATHSLDLLNWMVDSNPVKVYATGGRDFYGGNEDVNLRCSDCDKAKTCNYWINAKAFKMDYGTSAFILPDYCVWSKDMDLDDNSQLLITYASGVKATFQECHFTPDYTREFWFIGTKGKMYGYFDNPGRFLIRIEYSHEPERRTEEWKPESIGGSHGGGDIALAEDFYNRIIENKKNIDSVKSAYYSTALAVCAHESIEKGMPVDIRQMK